MKYIINGREYPFVNHQTAQVLHLMELRQQTRAWTEDGKGLGQKALQRLHDQAVRAGDAADVDDAMLAFAAFLFLTRRAAGDKVSFEDAAAVAFADVQVVKESGDEPADEPQGPTAPGGTETPAPLGDPAADPATNGLSTT
jgi:hypothetical protein